MLVLTVLGALLGAIAGIALIYFGALLLSRREDSRRERMMYDFHLSHHRRKGMEPSESPALP